MRHLIKGRTLNRTSSHLLALKRNLAANLFANERIVTTVPKAKELRPFAEKLITIAKNSALAASRAASASGEEAAKLKAEALHGRRLLIERLGSKRTIVVKEDKINVINKLLDDLGPRYQKRNGGYTRIVKRTVRRLGDAAPTAIIELVRG